MVTNLQLLDGETTAESGFHVVSQGGALNNWANSRHGPWGNAEGLLNPVLSAAQLTGRLVEPSLHSALPVFLEMTIRNDIVVFGHGLTTKE